MNNKCSVVWKIGAENLVKFDAMRKAWLPAGMIYCVVFRKVYFRGLDTSASARELMTVSNASSTD